MTATFDLVIRGGTVVDGSGAEPFEADVAVSGKTIARVGKVDGHGAEEIDARGRIVTPGFVDLHTHLDGHVTWESHLYPVTGHGVTTAVIGNCGVGFAPCRPEDRDSLIRLMETVEDIGFADLSKGLPWNWESYDDYLDALSQRRYNMDVGGLLPHSTLRAYVMGERSLSDQANAKDLEDMSALARRAVAAGALGFGSSILKDQRTSDGRHIPSYLADETEFTAIANGMSAAGSGVFQVAIEFNQFPLALEQLEMFRRVGKSSGRPVLFSLKQTNRTPEGWRDLLEISDRANAEGVAMHPQVLGRPTGAIFGLQTTMNPFSRCPSFAPIAKLPLAEKVAAMRSPELRTKLISEADVSQGKLPERMRGYHVFFPLDDPPNYEPEAKDSVESLARARAFRPRNSSTTCCSRTKAIASCFSPAATTPSAASSRRRPCCGIPHSVPGLGDAGAHAGIICDASATTYMMSYWTRDRSRGPKLELPQVVKWMTRDCARVAGLDDRGLVAPGYKADINVVDYDNLKLRPPRATQDLPAGGTRLVQDAEGYTATIVSGVVVHRDDKITQALPGRVVRGAQACVDQGDVGR